MANKVIGVDDRLPVKLAIPLGLQHFMSMFGSTVLVPILTGMSPSLAIMCSGIGTILYLLVTKSKIPSYLGSSFAFITPIAVIGASEGISAALSGIVVAGLVYMLVAGIIRLWGTGWIKRILPTPVVAPVIIVIGLGLAAVAIKMAFNSGGATFVANGFIVAMLTLFAAVAYSCFFKGFICTIPILLAIITGYIIAVLFGMVNFQPVIDAAWVGLPQIKMPTFSLNAILLIAPVALVVVIEHIGHLLVVGEIVGKDYSPMLSRSLFGDGLATTVAGFLGGTPATTYAENIGVMSATKVYSTQIFWYAGGFALLVGGFCPKIEALINSIPTPVIGGVSLLLFGLIATNGLRMIVTDQVDFSKNRNTMIVAIVLVIGIGMETSGISIPLGNYTLPGMATSAIIGVLLNLILPREKDEPDESIIGATPADQKSLDEQEISTETLLSNAE
jgi:uracil-xanthine permease